MADFAVVLWAWRGGRHKGRIDYGPELLNRQAKAIRANLRIQHDLVAITDYPEHEFDSQIRVVPLWDDWRDLGKCYTRLRAFAPDMKEVIAPRFAWFDLDAVVVGELSPLFHPPYDFRIWRPASLPTQPYNGSLVLMKAGAKAQVYTEFRDRPQIAADARMEGYRGSDQAIIAHVLGRDQPTWTLEDGVCYLGLHCTRRGPPEHARIVFSPGGSKVTDPIVQRRYPWLAKRLGLSGLDERPRVDLPRWLVGDAAPPPTGPDALPPRYHKPRWRRMQEIRREARLAAKAD